MPLIEHEKQKIEMIEKSLLPTNELCLNILWLCSFVRSQEGLIDSLKLQLTEMEKK